jgi:two-component system, chemotaxis family, CheB/CheR fusion protein
MPKRVIKAAKGPGKKPTDRIPAPKNAAPTQPVFRVVGIGASAEGLEALEQFFGHLSPDTGMAFVIVQHLDPTGHSSMPEILTRFTKMPVRVAEEGMRVAPNSIYLIPPNKSLGIQKGVLFLQEPARPPGLKLPIDFFFRSLAADKGADAIGIILSGTGTDGTLGLREIKAESGMILVQDPVSARYDGMPRSAIDTGLVDLVLKPEDMPGKLDQFLKHLETSGAMFGTAIEESIEPLQEIFTILRTRTGHDFSKYKIATVRRRLQRRMSVNQISDISGYAKFIRENEMESNALLRDLLISVTSFFRDPEAFEALKLRLKEILRNKPQGADFRVWVAGCATGEEAYSLAIIIFECLEELKKQVQIQMYGTDIDVDALQRGRAGLYPANIAADVTPERLKNFFLREKEAYRVKKELREVMVFAPQNFIKDPPFSRMDLICCRNVLIYLDNEVQRKLLPLLHYALNPGGILFLGPSETAGDAADLFTTLDRKWKIFQRREVTVPADRLQFPSAFAPVRGHVDKAEREAPQTRILELAEKIFLDNYAPTFAVIDDKYRLVLVRGRTGKYLEIASGQKDWTILEMAREGLRTELGSAIFRANAEKRKIVRENVRVKTNGDFQMINLTIAPLHDPGIPSGLLMVIFQEASEVIEGSGTHRAASQKHATRLEEELKLTKENLQSTIEELEATNEEMKSANEELQSNNEELQSTNEELDTSREELQSLNEELSTLNAELRDKNELLVKANDDLKNFLNRTDIAIIFLDEELKIRSYTPATTDVFNIRNIDIGRPLEDITSRLDYAGVTDDARSVLRTLTPKEIEVQRKDGHWYEMRILPYLTVQNAVGGLVISFLDVDKQRKAVDDLASTNKQLKEALEGQRKSADTLIETKDYLENLLNSANAPIIVWNPEFEITRFNHAFERLTGRTAEEVVGGKIDILFPVESHDKSMKHIRAATFGERWEVVEIPIGHKNGAVRLLLWNSATLYARDGQTVIATIAQGQDITDRKKTEQFKDEFIGLVSHELRTPMTVINGSLRTAMSPSISEEDKQTLLENAIEGAGSLSAILENLLELSRYQAGRLQIHTESVNISRIAAIVIGKLKTKSETHRFTMDFPRSLPLAEADPVRVERILYNLVENAAKYSPENSEVKIFSRQENGFIVTGVTDKGTGLSPDDQDSIFKLFERIEKKPKAEGLGLGLVVCKRLVEAQGGKIWVESSYNKGSTFYFTLPVKKPAP